MAGSSTVGVERAEVTVVPTGHTRAGLYEVRVQGRLEPRWDAWFEGYTVTPSPDGTTVISGAVIDQAALHGLLQALRDLGLPLVSVEQVPDDSAAVPGQVSGPRPPAVPPTTVPAQEEPR